MNKDDLKETLELLFKNRISVDDAFNKIKMQPYSDLSFAKIDNHRGIRQGAGEVIYGAGKTAEQIIDISSELIKNGESSVLVTRLDAEKVKAVSKSVDINYDATSKLGIIGELTENKKQGKIVVITAGTSDIPVAEEAAQTAEFYSNNVIRLYDVGVSGIHRLLDNVKDIFDARVIIAVAGMEGALASVVGGLADCPVIAVPTSVGYGASFDGLCALLSMLNSCASGVSVVNIDNGFGAGYLASMINKM